MSHRNSVSTQTQTGFLSAFCPGEGGQNEIVWIIGGASMHHVQSMWQNRGVWGHAPLGNFDFGPFIRCNLVESGTVFLHKHNLPFIVSLKLL